ncbi:MAG: AEC family transporter [Bacillus sp. (in: Bacteria)]|nr:AEC family transporter [Bacillus sp. (in: firmicutes)]
MTIFTSVVLPVLLIFAAGYGIQRWKNPDVRSVSAVAIFVMTPALVFRTFYTAEIDMQYAYMVIFSIILMMTLIVINKLYVWKMKYSPRTENGLILSTVFMNSGNYGAPIVLFAYGTVAFDYAVSLLVLHAILMNFFGVYYAARGPSGVRMALKAVLTMPATYAVIIAIILKLVNVQVPDNLFSVIDIVAEAAIPTVMVILGMQLAKIHWGKFEWGKITYATTIRLIVSPLIAWFLVLMMPLDPLLGKVLILTAAMPSAATVVMYAIEFDMKPRLVSGVTLITTLLSIVTITILLLFL